MKIVGAFEAKTKLSELLRAVDEQHEEIIIKKHNRNIARLIPFEENRSTIIDNETIIEGFRKIREKQKNTNLYEIDEMINAGRKR